MKTNKRKKSFLFTFKEPVFNLVVIPEQLFKIFITVF